MPRAADAFLSGPLPLTHDPLQRIDYQATKPNIDLEALLAQVQQFLQDYVFPIIKDLTGLDFSSPEDFFFSLVTMITNGGSAVLAFVDALTSPIVAAIKSFTGIDLGNVFQGIDLSGPGAVLGAIQKAIQDLVGGLIQKIIDAIVGGLNGSGSTGNDPLSIALSFLNPNTLLGNLGSALQNGVSGLLALFAGLDGRVKAVESNVGTISPSTTGSGFDNFNRSSIGPNWTNVKGALYIQNFTDGFLRSTGFAAGYYNAGHPLTDKHGVTVRLTAKAAGACRVYICADTALSNFAAMDVRAGAFGEDYVRIVTGSSPNVVVAQKQQDYHNFSLQDNTVLSIRFDPATNEFFVLKDGSEILRWADDGNIVSHGASKRICGVATNVDNSFFTYGPAITDYTYYDL